MATARLRIPARPAASPRAASATRPIAAARSTLGSVRHSPTNTTTPANPTPRSHHPRTPSQRAPNSRKASSRVRLAPETAVRWVRPAILKASTRSGGTADVSPSTRAGTSPRTSACDPATAARRPERTRSTSRSPVPGGATTCACRTRSSAASPDPGSGGSSRPSTLHRLPTGAERHQSATDVPLTMTTTGTRTRQPAPRPCTASTVARTTRRLGSSTGPAARTADRRS